MSADYTLPPLPEHNGWENELGKPYWVAAVVLRHGQQCAEAGRAPLLAANAALSARIAKLEADAKRYRWLRKFSAANPPSILERPVLVHGIRFGVGWVDAVDATIDAAMNEGTNSDREAGDA